MQIMVYGINNKERTLFSSEIDIDKSQNGVFKIILKAISARKIGNIPTNEGKPLFKIIGELPDVRRRIQ